MDEPTIYESGAFIDDRGFLTFFNELPLVKRMYVVENHKEGFIRAWHGHEKEGKYLFAISGDFVVGAVPLKSDQGVVENVKKFVLSSRRPSLLYIPPGYYNGLMNIQKDARLMIFSTSTVEESAIDDIRLAWNTWMIWDLQDYR